MMFLGLGGGDGGEGGAVDVGLVQPLLGRIIFLGLGGGERGEGSAIDIGLVEPHG